MKSWSIWVKILWKNASIGLWKIKSTLSYYKYFKSASTSNIVFYGQDTSEPDIYSSLQR